MESMKFYKTFVLRNEGGCMLECVHEAFSLVTRPRNVRWLYFILTTTCPLLGSIGVGLTLLCSHHLCTLRSHVLSSIIPFDKYLSE